MRRASLKLDQHRPVPLLEFCVAPRPARPHSDTHGQRRLYNRGETGLPPGEQRGLRERGPVCAEILIRFI